MTIGEYYKTKYIGQPSKVVSEEPGLVVEFPVRPHA